jgi:DNA-binding NtrC family response regulator
MEMAILCVDDEQIILESLQMQLENNFGDRFNYEFAESPEEALTIADTLYADGTKVLVIVSDWLMPGMRGDELLVKMHERYPAMVKIMLTGQADEKAVENAVTHANLHRCLQKPWNVEALVEAITSGMKLIESRN